MISYLLASLLAATDPAALPDGVWTNEEQVYFEQEAGRAAAAWRGFRIRHSQWQEVDRFGVSVGSAIAGPVARHLNNEAVETTVGGQTIRLRRARPFTCWMAARRTGSDGDKSGDWLFVRDLATHDQGGRLTIGGSAGMPSVTIRLRNVIWPPPTRNRPSVVVYAFTEPLATRAEGYAWANPDARTLGLNLRWMQASCTRTGD